MIAVGINPADVDAVARSEIADLVARGAGAGRANSSEHEGVTGDATGKHIQLIAGGDAVVPGAADDVLDTVQGIKAG